MQPPSEALPFKLLHTAQQKRLQGARTAIAAIAAHATSLSAFAEHCQRTGASSRPLLQALFSTLPAPDHEALVLVGQLAGAVGPVQSSAKTKAPKGKAAPEPDLELRPSLFAELQGKEGEVRLSSEVAALTEIIEALLEHDEVCCQFPCVTGGHHLA